LTTKVSNPDKTEYSFSKRTETFLKLAMILTGPLLLLGLLEGVSFVWERTQAQGQYAWELVASRRIKLIEFTEPRPGYTLLEPDSRYEWQGIPVSINSHGLRNGEVSYEKPENTFRILNLGDSVAMGWGVRHEETYGKLLEGSLNLSPDLGFHFEVINSGVPGWNLENELTYLRAEGLKYDPDLILLDITIVNDIYGGNALQTNRRPAPIEWLRESTYSWPFLSIQYQWMTARSQGRERIDVIDPPYEPSKYFPLDEEDKQWEKIWSWLSSFDTLSAQEEVPLVLVLFPLEYQLLDETYSTLPQELIIKKSNEMGIPVVDLLPSYRQACREKPGGACQLEDRYLFADVWMHPSAIGHQLTAKEIQQFLLDEGFINQ
jgi:hypothetical protein